MGHSRGLAQEIESQPNTFKGLEFEAIGLLDLIEKKDPSFDIIHVGFAIDRPVFHRLREALCRDPPQATVLAPVYESKEGPQKLTLLSRGRESVVMETFFSDIVEKNMKDASKFFLENEKDAGEKPQPISTEKPLEDEEETTLKKKEALKVLEEEFKELFQEFKTRKGMSKVRAKELMLDPKLNSKLAEINDLKRKLK